VVNEYRLLLVIVGRCTLPGDRAGAPGSLLLAGAKRQMLRSPEKVSISLMS